MTIQFPFIFTLILNIISVKSLFLVLDPKTEKCISRIMEEKENFGGTYFISGEKEEQNKVYIKGSDGKIIWESLGQKNSNFSIVIDKKGEFSLCALSTSDTQLIFQFEFYEQSKTNMPVSVQNVENLNVVIRTVRSKLDIIHSNIRNSAVRRNTHAEGKNYKIKLVVSAGINSKISFYTGIKIIFLILFSLFQIKMLTNIFSKVKVIEKIQVEESQPVNKYTGNNPVFL